MNVIRKSSVFAAVFLGLFVTSARAQEIITVRIPFSFVVGHEEFPAGQYDIRSAMAGMPAIAIHGMDNASAAFAMTSRADGNDPAGDQPALVFTRYENEYRLSQIWESATDGLDLAAAPGDAQAEGLVDPSAARTFVITTKQK